MTLFASKDVMIRLRTLCVKLGADSFTMLISLRGLDSIYRDIRKTISSQRIRECQVLVVSLSNVDGLCATKILLHLFKSDFIQYLLIPISSCLELTKIGELYLQPEINKNDQYHIKYLILINCGAMLDLSQCLSIHPELTVYVFDSHRPVHLSNVFADNQIQVIDDGQLEFFAQELWPAFSALELGEYIDDLEQENIPIDDNMLSDNISSKNRKNDISEYRSQLLQYYRQGDWIGSSTSSFMYALAGQLQKSDSDMLWYCIVGITACLILENSNEEKYFSDIELLNGEVNRMFNPSSNSSSSSSDSSSSSTTRKSVIQEEEELRFLLLHHWSLYQSMFHSPYVASILHPWNEKGKRKLESFLARIGVSLKQSNQPFTFTDSQIKKRIFTQLERYGPEEGLKNLFFSTFVRRYGYKLRVSASDAIYSIQAILCHSSCINSKDSLNESLSDIVKNNFHVAFDALDIHNVHLLQLGIQLAKIHSQRLIKAASYIFNLKVIKNLKRFRLGVLTQPSRGSSRLDHTNINDNILNNQALSSYQDDEPWSTAASMRSLSSFICESQKVSICNPMNAY